MKDEEIIRLYFGREEKAIAETENKYGKLCRKIAFGILGNNEDTDEAINSVYIKLWEAIPPKEPESLCGYVCRIARNVSLTMYKKNSKNYETEQLTELTEILADSETTESRCDNNSLAEALNRFLGTLNKQSRNIFMARYYFNLPVNEIADRFGLSETAMRSRLFRIRQQLRAYLSKEGIEV